MNQERLKLWAEKEEWNLIQGTKEAEITSVALVNERGESSQIFSLNDTLKVIVSYKVREITKTPHFGVAIFREDGVYCYGPNTMFDGIEINGLSVGLGFFQIEFKRLKLAGGDYRISVAIWDKKEIVAYSYHPACYKFRMNGTNRDGRLLELEHQWIDALGRQIVNSLPEDFYFNQQFLAGKWKKRIEGEDSRIVSVVITDRYGREKHKFIIGEDVYVKVRLDGSRKFRDDHYIWIGLYRKDGVYCFGAHKGLKPEENEVLLYLPRLNLLRGGYVISVARGSFMEEKPQEVHHALYPFEMGTFCQDHGTIYIEHSWKGSAIDREIEVKL